MKYRNCSSNRSIQNQSVFENSLLEIMSAKKYADITVTDIANQAGLSRKSFYHYFDGKDGCLKALVDHTLHDLHSQQMLNPDGTLSLAHIFCYWKEQHRLLDALFQNHMTDLLLSRTLYFATVEDGFRTYVARTQGDITREQVVLLIGGLVTVLMDWYLSGYEADPQAVGESLDPLFTRLFPAADICI